MRIAVASQNFRTITSHAGRTRRFLVYDARPGEVPAEVGRLDMPQDMALHNFHGTGDHPLYAMDAIIVGSAGAGFVHRMAARGVRVAATAETDPQAAVTAFLAGTLPPAAPHEHTGHKH